MLFSPAVVGRPALVFSGDVGGSGCGKGDTEVEDEEGSGLGDVCRGSVLEKEA